MRVKKQKTKKKKRNSNFRVATVGLVLILVLSVTSKSLTSFKAVYFSDKRVITFDPQTMLCKNSPRAVPVKNKDGKEILWQTSAPREPLQLPFDRQGVELGLRNKFGGVGDKFYYTVTVKTPYVTEYSTKGLTSGDNWSYVYFPKGFRTIGQAKSGVYTITYTIDGSFIACDGFVAE